MNLMSLLPEYGQVLDAVGINNICEMRLRANQPIRVLAFGKWNYLSDRGLVNSDYKCFVTTGKQLEDILFIACEHSVYAYSQEIVQGFLTISNGIRIGVVGTLVKESNIVRTIKDVTSLIIRLPHNIVGCCDKLKQYIFPPCNVLVASAPGCGKTTLLRDIARFIGKHNYNVLIADERREIALETMTNCDVYLGEKVYAMQIGIRTVNPDVIICDELSDEEITKLESITSCGIKLYASIHADSFKAIKTRLKDNLQMFDYIVLLNKKTQIGQVEAVYDNLGNLCN
ncbi:MAG: ATPase, T2SS/T4P/T4SS family [Clostridia bacterium]